MSCDYQASAKYSESAVPMHKKSLSLVFNSRAYVHISRSVPLCSSATDAKACFTEALIPAETWAKLRQQQEKELKPLEALTCCLFGYSYIFHLIPSSANTALDPASVTPVKNLKGMTDCSLHTAPQTADYRYLHP